MSHYAVVVFCNKQNTYEFDKLMEPFNECDEKYYTFHELSYTDYILPQFNKFKTTNPDSTLETFLKYKRYKKIDGKYGYMCNPNGFYDYYTLDGKSYLYEIKPGEELEESYYRKNQIDWFYVNKREYNRLSKFWDECIDKKKKKTAFYSCEYYLDRYKTKEQFLYENKYTVPFAYITPDGVWHAPGRMGWFAMSNETAESFNEYFKDWKAYIQDNTINPFVSIVDCHI